MTILITDYSSLILLAEDGSEVQRTGFIAFANVHDDGTDAWLAELLNGFADLKGGYFKSLFVVAADGAFAA